MNTSYKFHFSRLPFWGRVRLAWYVLIGESVMFSEDTSLPEKHYG